MAIYENSDDFRTALHGAGISFGPKTTEVFNIIIEDLLLTEEMAPSEYVSQCYAAYKNNYPNNNALNGYVFEMIVESLFFQLELIPLYSQVKLTYVPNIEFDFILFKSKDFLDARGNLLYTGVQPVCISLKTSSRERYKQADLEAMALKNVHRNAKCYLIGLEDVTVIQNKINNKDTFGLDNVYNAVDEEFDAFIAELREYEYVRPSDVPVYLSGAVIDIGPIA